MKNLSEAEAARKRQRRANRWLDTSVVLERLREDAPEAYALAEIVGRWVWVSFADKPGADVRNALKNLGFSWNKRRECWQHPCGHPTKSSPGDPRFKYGSVPASALDDETKARVTV